MSPVETNLYRAARALIDHQREVESLDEDTDFTCPHMQRLEEAVLDIEEEDSELEDYEWEEIE